MPTTLRHTPWHALPLTSPIRSAPPLLLQSTFTSTSYTIHLTDLTHIWTETLLKREILLRAETENTAIDPSEDYTQFTILLQKLQDALSKPADHVDITLTSSSAGELRLKTTTELPAPLRELTWTFKLAQQPRVTFTNLFVLPLLSAVSTLRDQTESLLGTVKDKDVVIERLTDQLKDQGMDVKSMLGGGRARRRGLEAFDVEGWRGDYRGEGEKRVGEVVKDVFGASEALLEEIPGVKGLGEVDGWWKGVENDEEGEEEVVVKVEQVRKVEGPKPKLPAKKVVKEETEDEDDEFERQKTPPRKLAQPITKKEPPLSPAPPADETASDSDDLDLPPPRKPPTTKKPSATTGKTGGGFGKITGKKLEPSKDLTPPPVARARDLSPPPVTRTRDVDMPDVTVGEETEDSDMVVVPRVPEKGRGNALTAESDSDSPAKVLPPQKKASAVKIVIGGKKKSSVSPIPPPPAKNTDSEEEAPKKEVTKPVKKTIGKIGKIGGKKILKQEYDGDDEDMKDIGEKAVKVGLSGPISTLTRKKSPPLPVKEKTPTPEPEDEDEKADRKRRQLEKELEAKKKAPAKKKRKF